MSYKYNTFNTEIKHIRASRPIKTPLESLESGISGITLGHLDQVNYSTAMPKCIFSSNDKKIPMKNWGRQFMEYFNTLHYTFQT